jgi:hypothetical protein
MSLKTMEFCLKILLSIFYAGLSIWELSSQKAHITKICIVTTLIFIATYGLFNLMMNYLTTGKLKLTRKEEESSINH